MVRPRLLTPEDAAQALQLRRDGMSLRDIAEVLEVSKDTVARTLREHVTQLGLAEPPVEVSSSPGPEPEVWPPPAGPDTTWRRQWIGPGVGGEWVYLRRVKLWGQLVEIDVEHRVWCPDCRQLVDVEELGRVTNSHRVGLAYRAKSGMLLPLGYGEGSSVESSARVDPLPPPLGSTLPTGW